MECLTQRELNFPFQEMVKWGLDGHGAGVLGVWERVPLDWEGG